MIGKILNLPFSKIATTVHGEMEEYKRHPSHEKSKKNNKENSHDANLDISQEELKAWVNELNVLECYVKNNLKFTFSFGSQHTFIVLVDKNGHTLQEYLPVQLKALYIQFKSDKADSRKGTILNLNC